MLGGQGKVLHCHFYQLSYGAIPSLKTEGYTERCLNGRPQTSLQVSGEDPFLQQDTRHLWDLRDWMRWLKNEANSHCMEDGEEGRARRTEGQMTQLTEVFISREGVLVEGRSVKKAPDKIKSKVPMLLSTKQQFFRSHKVWPNTALATCPVYVFE